jgi:MoaA/NifB/PqqE/SkfB family radical SAM enzyme
MNILTISIGNYCNFSCKECPLGRFRIKSKIKDNGFDVSKLNEFIKKWINPKEWVIEITGGEPTLINSLEPILEMIKDYKVSVLTNTSGLKNIKHYPNVKFICSWHENQITFDKFIDNIKSSSNRCIGISYPNKNNIDCLLLENDIEYIYGTWDEDPLTLYSIAKHYGIDAIIGNEKLVLITPNGEFHRCVCFEEQCYANISQFEAGIKEFEPQTNRCNGEKWKMCSTVFRNRVIWGYF